MTANHEHTPTTDLMRQWHVLADHSGNKSTEEYEAEFDRWLATVEAAAEQRGAARGWDEGCKAGLDTGLTIGEVVMGLKPRPVPAPPENPYRADLLEDDDG